MFTTGNAGAGEGRERATLWGLIALIMMTSLCQRNMKSRIPEQLPSSDCCVIPHPDGNGGTEVVALEGTGCQNELDLFPGIWTSLFKKGCF